MDNDSNRSRKILLEKIDSKEEIPKEILLMYGLTPYMTNADTNTGLRILDYKLKQHYESRKLLHNENFSLMPEQAYYLNELHCYDKIIFKAPTSFGKSLLLKEYIYINKPNTVVYIVPTNSLANELEESYKETFGNDYEIFDSIKSEVKNLEEKKLIFIGTQEKFFSVRHIFSQIDMFILDEAYKLQGSIGNTRNIILSKSLLEEALQKASQIFLLLPNAKIKKENEYGFKVLETSFNAVDKKYVAYNDIDEKIYDVYKQNEKTIVYFTKPSDISKFISNFSLEEDTKLSASNFLQHLKKEYTSDFSVYKALEKGIVIHHGQIPKYLQKKLLNLFNNSNEFNLLLGTSSVSEGINTPTKNIIFNSKVDVTKDKMLIKNTIGRAGRLGKYPIGTIIGTEEQITEIQKEKEIEISFSFIEEENREQVETISRIDKINELCKRRNIDMPLDIIIKLEELNLSLHDLETIFKYFQEEHPKAWRNEQGEYFTNIIIFDLLNTLNGKPFLFEPDKAIIDSMLFSSKYIEGKKYPLSTFKDKIQYLTEYCEKRGIKRTNTQLIDLFFKHRYSTLEYKMLPIFKIVTLVSEYITSETFLLIEKNILDTKSRYATYVIKTPKFFELSEDEQTIISRLSEYGIPVNNIELTFIQKIVNRLSNRYSMYDIKKVIEKIFIEENNATAKELLDTYL